MKTKIKVGDSFEVVEVLKNTFSDKTLFKIGGFTLGMKYTNEYTKCIGNGTKKIESDLSRKFMSTCYLNMRVGKEVKPIGKLTITKVK